MTSMNEETAQSKPTLFANYSPVAVHVRKVSYPPHACVICGEPILRGHEYVWRTRLGAAHLMCDVREQDANNEPHDMSDEAVPRETAGRGK